MAGLNPNCTRCDGPLDAHGGELQTVYCARCLELRRREMESLDLTPYVVAYCVVSDRRLEVMREEGRISSPGCRQLRRVLDYLDIMCDLETLDWPEVLNV